MSCPLLDGCLESMLLEQQAQGVFVLVQEAVTLNGRQVRGRLGQSSLDRSCRHDYQEQ